MKGGHPISLIEEEIKKNVSKDTIVLAEKYILQKLNPKSGTLKTGIMNNDFAALLMAEFAEIYCKPNTK